jgi:hypothetical protein
MNRRGPSLMPLRWVLSLLVCLQAGVLPRGLVLCVHSDGRSEIEALNALCCRTDPRGETCCEVERGEDASGAGRFALGQGERCRDFPLAADLRHAAPASRSWAWCEPPASSFLARDASGDRVAGWQLISRGPGAFLDGQAAGPLLHLRTVVLRC